MDDANIKEVQAERAYREKRDEQELSERRAQRAQEKWLALVEMYMRLHPNAGAATPSMVKVWITEMLAG